VRIVHVLMTLDPAAGGPPVVVTRLASAQASLGHDVHVLTHRRPGAEERTRKALEGVPGWDRVHVMELEPGGTVERVLARHAASVLEGMIDTVDVVHTHNTWAPIVLAASKVCRRHEVPYAHCAHGTLDPWCLSQKALKKKIALAVSQRAMLNSAMFLHVLNRDERDLLAPLKLSVPMEVIPNGIFIDEFEPMPEPGSFHQEHPEIGGAPYILFLSRLHYKKGLDYLADAFAIVARAVPEAHLVVAGPDGGAQASFEASVAAHGVADRVHVVGPIYGRAKLAALADASCFCLPSRQEGFSIAITEALACAVPAVVSDACHYPEVAEAEAGEVVTLDAGATARALIRVMSDVDLRRRMGGNGARLVRDRFTWPKIAERAVECYRAHMPAGAHA
jgi:glycosyltransferase involved in cell wall biosynthesis